MSTSLNLAACARRRGGVHNDVFLGRVVHSYVFGDGSIIDMRKTGDHRNKAKQAKTNKAAIRNMLCDVPFVVTTSGRRNQSCACGFVRTMVGKTVSHQSVNQTHAA